MCGEAAPQAGGLTCFSPSAEEALSTLRNSWWHRSISTSGHQGAERRLAWDLKHTLVLNQMELEGASEDLGLLFISQLRKHRPVGRERSLKTVGATLSDPSQGNYCSFFALG